MDVWKAYKAPELGRVRETDPLAARPASSVVTSPSDTTTSVAISKPADILKKLSALQQSDATKFKHLMGALAGNLKAAANPGSGAVGAELSQFADRLTRVAKTGDLSTLQLPTQSPPISFARNAIEAYRRNAPAPAAPTATVDSALDYVLAAVNEASQ
jgi:hypothetical protein